MPFAAYPSVVVCRTPEDRSRRYSFTPLMREDGTKKLGAGKPAGKLDGFRGIDAAVATLSSGVLKEGNHVAMIGTSMCRGFITNRANLSPKLVSFPNVVDPLNTIYTFGGAATAGAVVRWFRDVFGRSEMEAERQLGIDAYTLLELQCKDIPAGSEGLLVLPCFMGERSPIWDGNARGTILGLSLYHRKDHLYNAFMEGVAHALRHNMGSVSGTPVVLDPDMSRLYAS